MKNEPTHKPRGRPRQFDRDEALERAMRLFWERGYDATSVSDLGAATGLNPPSLYAAFQDKESLFLEAVDRYQAAHSAIPSSLFDAGGTARSAIAAMLRAAAGNFSDPRYPNGCMVVLSGQNCSEADGRISSSLKQKRKETQKAFERRLVQGQADGDVPASSDAAALAQYAMTVLEGMSIQARDGASAQELMTVADIGALAIPETTRGPGVRSRASAKPRRRGGPAPD